MGVMHFFMPAMCGGHVLRIIVPGPLHSSLLHNFPLSLVFIVSAFPREENIIEVSVRVDAKSQRNINVADGLVLLHSHVRPN